MSEIWKAIPNYEGMYEASTLGNIRSLDRQIIDKNGFARNVKGRKMALFDYGEGCYLGVNLTKNGQLRKYYVQEVILMTFVSPRPKGWQACHCNGSRQDNKLFNLRWDSPKNNINDKHYHGTIKIGSDHPQATLKESQVLEIKLNKSASIYDLADCYGCGWNAVAKIRYNIRWKWLVPSKGDEEYVLTDIGNIPLSEAVSQKLTVYLSRGGRIGAGSYFSL